MEKKKIFEVVSILDELPPNGAKVFCINNKGKTATGIIKFLSIRNIYGCYKSARFVLLNVIHWLRETEKYVLSEEQLAGLLREAIEFGSNNINVTMTSVDAENKVEEFLKSKNLFSEEQFKSLFPIEFLMWYSGMEKEKIIKAFERYKKESVHASKSTD